MEEIGDASLNAALGARRGGSTDCRAVIDIGTNSVKLLIAELEGERIIPLFESSEQTRLGRGFYPAHRLQAEAVARTAGAVAEFAALARRFGAASTRVIATSAVRDAVNREEVLSAVRGASGLAIEVISGEREADWVFRGVVTCPELTRQPLCIADVGGGSTEIIVGDGAHPRMAESFPLGTVRLLEQMPPADPPRPEELARTRGHLREVLGRELLPRVAPALEGMPGQAQLVGTGGTIAILARVQLGLTRFDRDQIERTRLPVAEVRRLVERLWALPIEERRALPGLPSERADVILTGAAIYEALLEVFEFREVRASTRGLRFAGLLAPPAPRTAGAP